MTLLLDNGANPEITNNDGETARNRAVACSFHDIVQRVDTWLPQVQVDLPQYQVMEG